LEEIAYWDLTSQFLLAVCATRVKGTGAVYYQMILAFVLQMEKSKRSTWME
jgi:hypothetical protein